MRRRTTSRALPPRRSGAALRRAALRVWPRPRGRPRRRCRTDPRGAPARRRRAPRQSNRVDRLGIRALSPRRPPVRTSAGRPRPRPNRRGARWRAPYDGSKWRGGLDTTAARVEGDSAAVPTKGRRPGYSMTLARPCEQREISSLAPSRLVSASSRASAMSDAPAPPPRGAPDDLDATLAALRERNAAATENTVAAFELIAA